MAHNLCKFVGSENVAMCYRGDVPWHGLGTPVPEKFTAAQALEAADIDREVVKRQVYADNNGEMVAVPGRYATMYEGQPHPLGVVSGDYRILQNRDAFSFFDPIVDRGEAIYETVGALGNGETVWMLAKLPEDVRVQGDVSLIQQYILFVNTHDGKSSLEARFTPVRVVCQNTLGLAMAGKPAKSVRIRHTGDLGVKLQEGAKLLGLARSGMAETLTLFARMLEKRVGEQDMAEYVGKVCDIKEDEEVSPRTEMKVRRIFSCVGRETRRNPSSAGTLYGLYQGVTDYCDHVVGSGRTTRADTMERAMFGVGDTMRRKALELACEMVGAN